MKYCEQCGVEYKSLRTTSKYCSARCRMAANRGDAPETLTVLPKLADVGTPVEITQEIKLVPKKPYDREKNLAAFQKMGLDPVTWISTGITDFDALTQIPRGRVTQIQGPYAVGKTTLALNMLKGLAGHKVLYIDSEAALTPEKMVDLGLEAGNFTLYNKSAFIEDIYDVIMAAVAKPTYELIIFDSLASCTFRTEKANAAADANIGQKARIIGKLMRIIPMELKATQTALVIINQEREVIGGYAPIKYTPGGMGVPYAASLMVALKTTKGARFPKSGPPFRGHEVTAEIIKSKVNEPWRKTTFKLFYNAEDMR